MKILLVDQDNQSLDALQKVISEKSDHHILRASSPKLALTILGNVPDIDLLITEIVMEEMDGFTLCTQATARNTRLKVIFVTGYDMTDYAGYLEGHTFLPRPIVEDDLLAALATIARALIPRMDAPKSVMIVPKPAPVAAPAPRPVVVTPQIPHQPAAAPAPIPTRNSSQPIRLAPIGASSAKNPSSASQSIRLAATPAPVAVAAKPAPAVAVAAAPVAVAATPVAVAPAPATPAPVAVAPAPVAVTPAPVVAAPAPIAATPAPVAVAAKPASAPVPVSDTPIAVKVPVPVKAPLKVAAVAKIDPAAADAPRKPRPVRPAPLAVVSQAGLAGSTIGSYHLIQLLESTPLGDVYKAVQTTIDRSVRLSVLPSKAPTTRKQLDSFLAQARVKAAVQHQHIVSVYEAGEMDDHHFFAQEFVEGLSLRQHIENGDKLNGKTVVNIVRAVAETYSFLQAHNVTHYPPSAEIIFLTTDGQIRVDCLAAPGEVMPADDPEEIKEFSALLAQLHDPAHDTHAPAKTLVAELLATSNPLLATWEGIVKFLRDIRPSVKAPMAQEMLSRRSQVPKVLEEARRKKRRSTLISLVSIGVIFWGAIAFFVWRQISRRQSSVTPALIEIPAGPFIYQDNQTETLPTFWIDKYEVTIGMYNDFLDALKASPSTAYDHPKQPKGRNHRPDFWDDLIKIARDRKNFRGSPMSIDHPVFNIDWFDAYAYAKWAGKRLPTEKEWEKAARGTKGFTYPWGNSFDPKKLNSGRDFQNNPAAVAEIDGYIRWAPVNGNPEDCSPYGVINMAGNVSEWVDAFQPSPKLLGGDAAGVRGGNFQSQENEDYFLTRRRFENDPLSPGLTIGFRTVSDTPPKKDEPKK